MMSDYLSFPPIITRFKRDFYKEDEDFSFIGDGELGGKAKGLAFIKEQIQTYFKGNPIPSVHVDIPRLVVITTDFFDQFMKENGLVDIALSDQSDERIAHHFLKADLPSNLIGDLWKLISVVHSPLAIRSSSLLEDSLHFPFAGVYETKMIPNNEADTDSRFHRLVDAIKFVYSSTFFSGAKNYMKSIGRNPMDEKMAVIIQEIVGQNHNKRFYPHFSGVAKSYNFYPFGHAKPQDRMVSLALGLGKIIVDEGKGWTYSPLYPNVGRPFGSIQELLKESQVDFWAVNMAHIPEYSPLQETECLSKLSLPEAEYDDTLKFVASTYDSQSDSIRMGIGFPGPRIINFASVLELEILPVNKVIQSLLDLAENVFKTEVEIEFAATIDYQKKNFINLGFLQVRPMAVSNEAVEVNLTDMANQNVLLASDNVMGNGRIKSIRDIIFVEPTTFEQKHTPEIAREIASLNRELVNLGIHYLLIGFGRWGSSDRWLGIPVKWEEISGARVMVESQTAGRIIDWSQGSHFFHNMSNLGVLYFSIGQGERFSIDWEWLKQQPLIHEGRFVKHLRTDLPLAILADGKNRQGVILKC